MLPASQAEVTERCEKRRGQGAQPLLGLSARTALPLAPCPAEAADTGALPRLPACKGIIMVRHVHHHELLKCLSQFPGGHCRVGDEDPQEVQLT